MTALDLNRLEAQSRIIAMMREEASPACVAQCVNVMCELDPAVGIYISHMIEEASAEGTFAAAVFYILAD